MYRFRVKGRSAHFRIKERMAHDNAAQHVVTWREKQIIWERIRSIYESDKLELGRDYGCADMLRTYRGWLSQNAGGSEAERVEDLSA